MSEVAEQLDKTLLLLNELQSIAEKKPTPPLGYSLYECDYRGLKNKTCPRCGSSLRRFLVFFRKNECINDKCGWKKQGYKLGAINCKCY